MNQNLKNLATVHKIMYDVIAILSDPNNDGKPFEIGVKAKSDEAQIKIYNILLHVFQEFDDLFIVKETEDLKVFVERKEATKTRSESSSDKLHDKYDGDDESEKKIDVNSIN